MSKDLILALRIKADLDEATAEIKTLRRDLAKTGEAAGKTGKRAKKTGKDIDGLGDEASQAASQVDGLGKKAKKTGADVEGLGKKARKTGAEVGGLGKKAKRAGDDMGGAGRGAGRFAGALRAFAPAAAALVALGLAKEIVESGRAMERLEFRFRAAAGSAEAGAAELAFVRAEAERLGIAFQGAAAAYSGFAAAAKGTALEGEAAREIFTAVAEAGRAMGLSADQQQGALLALEQMISKGVVSAEELRGQLGERLPGAFQLAARAMGVTTKQLGEMLQRGEILAEDLLPKLARELRASVAEALPGATEGADAAITRLENAIWDLGVAIAESGVLDLAAGLATAATAVVRFATPGGDLSRVGLESNISVAETALGGPMAGSTRRNIEAQIKRWRRELEKFSAEIAAEADAFTADTTLDHYSRDTTAAPTKAAEKALAQLARRIALTGDLSQEQTTAWEIAEGRWKAESQATQERLLAGARRLDQLAKEGRGAEEARRKDKAATQARAAALKDLKAQALALLPAYQRERAEIEAWKTETLAALEGVATTREEQAARRAEVERIAAEKIRELDEAEAKRRRDLAAEEEGHRNKAIEAAEEEAERRLRASRHWQDGAIRGLKDYGEAATDAGQRAEDAVGDGAKRMEDALTGFVTSGKLEVSDLADHIIAEMARAAIRQNITGPLASGFGDMLGSLFGGGNALADSGVGFDNPGGVGPHDFRLFHAGGIVGAPGGARRAVPPAIFAQARRWHTGGVVGIGPREMPAILEKGEEVLTARDPRHRDNLARMPGALPLDLAVRAEVALTLPERVKDDLAGLFAPPRGRHFADRLRSEQIPVAYEVVPRGDAPAGDAAAKARAPAVPPPAAPVINISNQGTPQREVSRTARFEDGQWVIDLVVTDGLNGGIVEGMVKTIMRRGGAR